MGTLSQFRLVFLTPRASSATVSPLFLLLQRRLSGQPSAGSAPETHDPFSRKAKQKTEKELAELDKASRPTDSQDEDWVNVR